MLINIYILTVYSYNLQVVGAISIDWFKGFESEELAVKYATEQAYFDRVTILASKFD